MSDLRPPSLLALPSYLAGSVARIGHGHLVAVLEAEGLRLPQYAVLAALSDFGPLAPNELATRLQGDRSHVSAYVEDLARRGDVRREPDPADRRRHTVVLTSRGKALFINLSRAAASSQDGFLASLTPDERVTLLTLLNKIIAHEDVRPPATGTSFSDERRGESSERMDHE